MKNSKIGWTDHTWNPWIGCTKVSEGCRNCYINVPIKRQGREPFGGPIRCTTTWRPPFDWDDEARELCRRHRVFTCSMSDFFHPGADAWRSEAWRVIRRCTSLDWLILTKRPDLIANRLPSDWGNGYDNVWLGTTVESNEVIRRIDILASIPAAIRFVSAEPLLGPVRFGERIELVDWVITGCEKASQDRRRTMDTEWVRAIRDECDAADVPLFHKQYYCDSERVFDGIIDGVVRQEFPLPSNRLSRHR